MRRSQRGAPSRVSRESARGSERKERKEMATFKRTVTISDHHEHQEGHHEAGWTIIDESPEFWTAEKEDARPERLKDGENPVREVLFSKREWKLVNTPS